MDNVVLRIITSLLRILEHFVHYLFGSNSFSITFGEPTEQSGSIIMAQVTANQMTNTQQQTVTLTPTNRLGKPGKIDGTISVSITGGENLVTVDPVDGSPGTFLAKGSGEGSGAPIATFTADADLGEGIETISVDVVFPIGEAPAAGFGATFSTPEEQA